MVDVKPRSRKKLTEDLVTEVALMYGVLRTLHLVFGLKHNTSV